MASFTPLAKIRALFDLPDAFSALARQWKERLSHLESRSISNAQEVRSLRAEISAVRQSLGRIEERQTANASSLRASEFQVYSQWGVDGILQYLLRHVPVPNHTFVEFGVETYQEANTRWLLTEHQWNGLVIDGSEANIHHIQADPIYWQHELKAIQSFITRENINELITNAGISGKIGLLSVDVDGVDYWIWEAIHVIDPAIVVVEYNSLLGAEAALTVPYDPAFVRSVAHHSCNYYGASLAAFVALGKRKGYALVGANSAGNNAFFIKRELTSAALPEVSAVEGYVRSHFRESRDESGRLSYIPFETAAAAVRELPFVPVEN